LDRLRTLGKTAYLEEQLKGDIGEDPALIMQIQHLDVYQLEPSDLWDLPFPNVLTQLQQGATLQAVYGRNQLRERMIDFWSNHFNIYSRKGNTGFSKGVEETKLVREHALGKFSDLLNGMAHSPAMLEFLDNQQNKNGGPNENYARELMELHTLGLHGGYTQKDVQEVARCFTGWTLEERFLHPKGKFRFDMDQHDISQKIVLGNVIPPGGGENDADQVLAILNSHPATANFICTKLSRYFLGEADQAWINKMSAEFRRTGGDIPSTLRPLLMSDDLVNGKPVMKLPFDYMVSALRATEADTDAGASVQEHLSKMGEPLYEWPMPDGYPVKAAAWTSSLLPRWNFAFALMEGGIRRTSPGIDSLTALDLCAPDFQWR
jgi:uncharacterized protein (DUF1800 family)